MSKTIYGDLSFSPDFIYAITADDEKIKFSKYERALLLKFTQFPNTLLNRERLLNTLQGVGSDSSDRNIDYLVSRLRRKLGDNTKTPIYIATQYGEGYIWVASPRVTPLNSSNNIYLSVGPIYGVKQGCPSFDISDAFIANFLTSLKTCFGEQRKVELLTENISDTDHLKHRDATYAVEVSFLTIENETTCYLTILNRKTGQTFATLNHKIHPDNDAETASLAKQVRDSIWNSQIFRSHEQRSISEEPLTTSLYNASKLFHPSVDDCTEVDVALRQQLQKNQNDHKAAILLATNIHNQMFLGDLSHQEKKNEEISHLIFTHLPHIQNDALFLSAAAERLFALGHHDLAYQQAQRALDIGPSFAACYMVLGRIKVMHGDFLTGIAYYEHALDICEKDSLFYIMLLTMKCIALKLAGRHDEIHEPLKYIIDKEENAFKKLNIPLAFYADRPEMLPAETTQFLTSIPKEQATHILRMKHYIGVRQFIHEEHRILLLKGSIELFSKFHGIDVVPECIKKSIPSYFADNATIAAQ